MLNIRNYIADGFDEAALFWTLKGKDTAEARSFTLLQHAKKRNLYVVRLDTTNWEEFSNAFIGVFEKRTSLLRLFMHSFHAGMS